MASSSKTLRAPLALQSSKQEPDMLHDSPRHSLPAQKTSMIRRFLRKDSQPLTVQTAADPTLLGSKPKCIQPQCPPSSTMPPTGSSEASGESSPLLSPSTLSTKTASSAAKVLPARKPHGSLTRVRQTLVRKINARRVGADPRSSSCTPSSPSSSESTSSVSSASEARSAASSPRTSTDSYTQPSASNPTLDRSQSKLKRWQTRSTNKLKTWLNVHSTQPELTSVDDSQDRSEIKQQKAFEPTPATPPPDLEVHSAEVAIQEHSAAAGSLVVSQDLLLLSGPLPPQDSELLRRRRASEHQSLVYTSALQALRDDHASYVRPLRSLSRRSLDGPGRIPVRSSSLPRSFSTASSASGNRHPLEQPEEGHLPAPSSPPALAAPYTTLDNILEDSKETTATDGANTATPAEYSEEAAAVVSEELSTYCAVSLPHPLDSADELLMPQPCSPLLTKELQEASVILSTWAAASASTSPHGRTLDLSVLSRKRRHCKARRLSDISVLVAKRPRIVRRETSKRRGWAADSDTPEREVVGDQTGHDPIESASLCSADHGTKRTSVVGTSARCLANDEHKAFSPLDFLETRQTPSLPTDTYTLDNSYPIHQVDSISNREIPCGNVTEMLFSVNPLLKARWQPKSTVYALSAINFWSSLHRQESLVV